MEQDKDHGMVSSNEPNIAKGKLCAINLLKIFEHVSKILDKEESVQLIYLGFQRLLITFFTGGDLKPLNNHRYSGKIFSLIKNQ